MVLKYIHSLYELTEIVSGGSDGADKEGENFAGLFGIPVKPFKADWEKYGKKAGPIRNQQMADYADACIAFKGDKGTFDMVEKARGKLLVVWDFTGNKYEDKR